MTTTSTFCGVGEGQRISSRVLKPPGGGSSISFGGDEDFIKDAVVKKGPEEPKGDSPVASPPAASPPGSPKSEAAPVTVNGSNGTNGTTATTTTPNGKANGLSLKIPANNGTTASPPNGSPTSGSAPTTPNGSGTPKNIDTQNRLFGDEPKAATPRSAKIRDHMRSTIFDGAANGANAGDMQDWKKSSSSSAASSPAPPTPEAAAPAAVPAPAAAPAAQPKQRIPPGGFSSKLW